MLRSRPSKPGPSGRPMNWSGPRGNFRSLSKKCILIQLGTADREYKSIEKEIGDFEVCSVERIENEDQWRTFQSEGENLSLSNPDLDLDIQYLYHGSSAIKDNLCLEGLDVRLCRRGLFGCGIYFSDCPAKCAQYLGNEEKMLLKCRVILGDSKIYEDKQIDDKLLREPREENGKIYHSVKGKPMDEIEYVVYNSRQVLVEYVIMLKDKNITEGSHWKDSNVNKNLECNRAIHPELNGAPEQDLHPELDVAHDQDLHPELNGAHDRDLHPELKAMAEGNVDRAVHLEAIAHQREAHPEVDDLKSCKPSTNENSLNEDAQGQSSSDEDLYMDSNTNITSSSATSQTSEDSREISNDLSYDHHLAIVREKRQRERLQDDLQVKFSLQTGESIPKSRIYLEFVDWKFDEAISAYEAKHS